MVLERVGPWATGRVLALPATLHPLRLEPLPPPPRAARHPTPPDLAGGACGDLAQALAMLHALPGALRACLLEAARLCGSGAGGAQANLLSMHWASQARTSMCSFFLGFRVRVDVACLLEAACLCGSGAGGAQADLLSMHGASQARTPWEIYRV